MAFHTLNHRLQLPPYVELQKLEHGIFSTTFYAVLEGPPQSPWYSIIVVTTTNNEEGQEVQVVPMHNGGEEPAGGVDGNGGGGGFY